MLPGSKVTFFQLPALLLAVLLSGILGMGCSHSPEPRSSARTEFVLQGYKAAMVYSDFPEDVISRKRAVYEAAKKLKGRSNVVIVYDASANMAGRQGVSGPRRFEAAYGGLSYISNLFNAGDNVRLLVFGGRRPSGIGKDGIIGKNDHPKALDALRDVELVYGSDTGFDRSAYLSAIRFLSSEKTYRGDAPIGYALLKALDMLRGLPNASVILITDGKESGPFVAQSISKDRQREQRLRNTNQDYEDITLAAQQAVERLIYEKVRFTPIIYGTGAHAYDRGDYHHVPEFYSELAKVSGSVYREVSSTFALVDAFIDAEFASVSYSMFPAGKGSQGGVTARGRVGVPLMLEEGRYTLYIDSANPLSKEVELRPGGRNRFAFDLDREGRLTIISPDNAR